MYYNVHNSTKDPALRTLRASRPTHDGHKQFITKAQIRLIRNRPVRLSEEQLLSNLAELKEKAAQGLLVVKTIDGRPVNLDTLTPGVKAVPADVRPNPPPDSVANDMQNVGIPMPRFQGGLAAPPAKLPDMGGEFDIPPPPVQLQEIEEQEEVSEDDSEESEVVHTEQSSRRKGRRSKK